MKITNIKWDTDGDVEALEALPVEVTLPADEFNREDYMEDGEFNEDAFLEDVSDWLSDTYEFCHDGFSMEGEDGTELFGWYAIDCSRIERSIFITFKVLLAD